MDGLDAMDLAHCGDPSHSSFLLHQRSEDEASRHLRLPNVSRRRPPLLALHHLLENMKFLPVVPKFQVDFCLVLVVGASVSVTVLNCTG